MYHSDDFYFLKALPKSQKNKRKDRKGAKRNVEMSDVPETESVASTISTIKAINPSFEEDQRYCHYSGRLMNFFTVKAEEAYQLCFQYANHNRIFIDRAEAP